MTDIGGPWRSPRRLPFGLTPDGAGLTWLDLDEDAYHAASFLDGRLLTRHGPLHAVRFEKIETDSLPPAPALDFIFHIGHVGSTLMARLLGDRPGVFALREPAILRDLAERPDLSGHLELILRLLSRTWRGDQRALVKATSFASGLGPALLAAAPDARALLMFSAPHIHMAGLLAGEGSRSDLMALAPHRRARLTARLGIAGTDLSGADSSSRGETAALAWACEILALADIAHAAPRRTAWLDFDHFLAEPQAVGASALRHLYGEATEAQVTALIASPHIRRYAKDPDQPFDPAFRAQVVEAALHSQATEVERGLAWLNALGARSPDFVAAARAAASGRLG